jgi:hypothetical protein
MIPRLREGKKSLAQSYTAGSCGAPRKAQSAEPPWRPKAPHTTQVGLIGLVDRAQLGSGIWSSDSAENQTL